MQKYTTPPEEVFLIGPSSTSPPFLRRGHSGWVVMCVGVERIWRNVSSQIYGVDPERLILASWVRSVAMLVQNCSTFDALYTCIAIWVSDWLVVVKAMVWICQGWSRAYGMRIMRREGYAEWGKLDRLAIWSSGSRRIFLGVNLN